MLDSEDAYDDDGLGSNLSFEIVELANLINPSSSKLLRRLLGLYLSHL